MKDCAGWQKVFWDEKVLSDLNMKCASAGRSRKNAPILHYNSHDCIAEYPGIERLLPSDWRWTILTPCKRPPYGAGIMESGRKNSIRSVLTKRLRAYLKIADIISTRSSLRFCPPLWMKSSRRIMENNIGHCCCTNETII